jgi:hypothetical protein
MVGQTDTHLEPISQGFGQHGDHRAKLALRLLGEKYFRYFLHSSLQIKNPAGKTGF